MDKFEAYKKYRKDIKSKIFSEYENADKYIYFHAGDRDLQKIRIPLPECPDWGLIEGFGLPKEKQFFKCEEYPYKLKKFEDDIKVRCYDESLYPRLSINQREKLRHGMLFSELRKRRDEFKEEIQWIKKQWAYRLYGKWFFNFGKPTYIDGRHWLYLNYWNLDGNAKPKFWIWDAYWFIAIRYFMNDTTIPEYIEIDGKKRLKLLEDGTPSLIDIKTRTVYGINEIKTRRVGESSKSALVTFDVISTSIGERGGIQGNKETTAQQIFKDKMLTGISGIPFFFMPKLKSYQPTTSIEFDSDIPGEGLNSRIDFATTSHRNYYDNAKLKIYQCEEPGKTINESILRRHNTIKECCSLHANITGFMIYMTTTYSDEEEEYANDEFVKLCQESHFQDRNNNGQTTSGLVNLFIPADKRLQGFINKFGYPVSNTPTKEDIKYLDNVFYNIKGEPIGAREYILNRIIEAEKNNRYDTLADIKSNFPLNYRDAFTPPSKNLFFDIKKIEDRIIELEFDQHKILRTGYLKWNNNIPDTFPIWVDDDLKPKFICSMMPEAFNLPQIKYTSLSGVKYPLFGDKFISSADAFRMENNTSNNISKGGGATRWMFDPYVDGDKKTPYDYDSQRLIMTYQYKPPTIEEYCEDMLLMCLFYGSYMYPEQNIDEVSKYFIKHGYYGFLLYEVNPVTGKKKPNPGFFTVPTTKADLFNLIRDDIHFHAHKCEHIEWLKDCLSIRNMDDMRKYDRFTAVAGTIRGEKILKSNPANSFKEKVEVKDIFRMFW